MVIYTSDTAVIGQVQLINGMILQLLGLILVLLIVIGGLEVFNQIRTYSVSAVISLTYPE